jgi:hypothetical protein
MTEIRVEGRGTDNVISSFPDHINWPEGTIVRYQNPDTGTSCIGISSRQHNCESCIFLHYHYCPCILGKGCIACAVSGDFCPCAIISMEDLI